MTISDSREYMTITPRWMDILSYILGFGENYQ